MNIFWRFPASAGTPDFSRTSFCPSCHQKRVVEFGEWLYAKVLKSVPHRQWAFSIPKRLRPWFSHDRKLLAGLSKCAWKILGQYLQHSVQYENAVAGGMVAVQTFGDFQNFNPHLHIIATDGCFYGQGKFQKANRPCPENLEPLFRQEVFKLLKAHGLMKIISIIEEPDIIKQILQYLCLWEFRNNGPPATRLNIIREPVCHPINSLLSVLLETTCRTLKNRQSTCGVRKNIDTQNRLRYR